LLYRAEASIMI